jgi:hypothetical protein
VAKRGLTWAFLHSTRACEIQELKNRHAANIGIPISEQIQAQLSFQEKRTKPCNRQYRLSWNGSIGVLPISPRTLASRNVSLKLLVDNFRAALAMKRAYPYFPNAIAVTPAICLFSGKSSKLSKSIKDIARSCVNGATVAAQIHINVFHALKGKALIVGLCESHASTRPEMIRWRVFYSRGGKEREMLTKKQLNVLLFVDAEIKRSGGVSPTMREIMDRLQARGFIRRIPRTVRSIEVLRVPAQPGAAA